MGDIRFAEGIKILPILAPFDTASTEVATSYVDLDKVHWASFWVQFGSLTSDSTDLITIKAEASTAGSSNATEVNVGGWYRLSAAVDTDTMGAVTAFASSDGVTPNATDDNKGVLIDIDPAVVSAALAGARFVRLVITPNSEVAACIVGVTAFLEPRFPGASIPSST